MQRVPWLTPTVTSAPFRAEYEIQVQRPLDGGGSETWQSTTLAPMDSSGRIRHELRWALLMPPGRRFGIFALLAALTFPSYAAKRLTIGQLEQTLKSAAAAHKTDIEIAQEIGQIKLSERISSEELEQLGREASKGPRTGLALQLLADVSSFLPLPASELPAIPSPDQPTQERQLEAMRKYALGMLPRLPNLLATRTTYSFDDSAQAQVEGSWPERAGLHLVGTSKTEVSVLSERENLPVKESGTLRAKNGLVTWGEFGSVLQLIIIDSANGTTTWNHWEQTATGLVSVFDYSVPKSASHYQIATPLSETRGSGGSGRWATAGGIGSEDQISASRVLRSTPAYHGTLWIDPANGTILRVSLVADLKGNPTLESGAILVEYGPVRMQGQTFMCPLRSLALSKAAGGVSATLNGTATEWLNENLFADYHLFASTSRILTGEADSSPSQTPATAPDSGASASATPPLPAIASSSHPPKETSAAGQPPIDLQVPPSPAPANAPPNELAVHNADVPITPSPPVSARASQPDQRSAEATRLSQAAPDSRTPDAGAAATFHLNVNAVLVPVVVRDGHGRSVSDLRKEDFEVFDNGKPRLLSGFLVEKGGHAQKAVNSQGAEAGNSRGAAQSQIVLPGRVTVFVFDDLDMDSEDIEHAQVAVSKVLDAALTGSDIAAVVDTSGRVNSGLTRDRAELDRALRAVRPSPIYRSAADCPKIGYYQADLIVNKHNENALQDVIQQIMWVCDPNTPDYVARRMAQASANAALALGQQGVHATYDSISEYVRRIAKLPGQHNMILLSSGFLPIEQDGRYAESALMNLAADSNVTIDAIDARGLYTTYLGAGNDTRGRDPNLVANLRDSEMRAEENAMGELAHATGGDFFHNNNDLESGLTELLNAPETVYVLELPMDVVKANGAYHQLKVSVDRADVQVQARKGYVAPRDEQARPRN